MSHNFETHRRVIKCNSCKEQIYSRYSGEYTSCECGDIAIDDTGFYCRVLGNRGNYEDLGLKEVKDLTIVIGGK